MTDTTLIHDALKACLAGTFTTALDDDHAAACDALIWNGRKPARQATIIVRAADAGDVAAAVRIAAEHDLSVSARSGGHQFTGIAARADMVIDLAALDRLQIDTDGARAVVGPAVTNDRLAVALDRHGLAFPVGHCGSVSVGGYLLGGGIGWNSGAWGMACFSVVQVEVVMADGRLLNASANENPDIFWAARGGGPDFFGIVTAFHLCLHEAPRAITTRVQVYPAARVAEVAAWAEKAVARAPAFVEFTAKVEPSPGGPIIAAIANIFAPTDRAAVETNAAFWADAPADPLAVIGPEPTPFSALYAATGASTPAGRRYGVDCYWSEGAFADLLARTLEAIAGAPSPESFGLVALRSNAMPLPSGGAFSRDGRVFVTLYGVWADAGADPHNLAWLRNAVTSAADMATGSYVGEGDLDRPGPGLPTLSGSATARLAYLARLHDPAGMFRRFRPARRHAA